MGITSDGHQHGSCTYHIARRAQPCARTVPCTCTVADLCIRLCTNHIVRLRPRNLGITSDGHQHGPCTDHVAHRARPCARTVPCTCTVADLSIRLHANNIVRSRPKKVGITSDDHQRGSCADHIVHHAQPCAMTVPCTSTVAGLRTPAVHEQYRSFTPKGPGYH